MADVKNTVIVLQNKLNSLSEKRFILYSVFAYFFLALIIILHHEVWADEIQAWLIARDSTSLSNLLYNLRYEGHPPLWHISLFLISRVTHDLIAMKMLHLIISTVSAFILLKYSLFTRLQKILIIFGYFFIYEYAAISRNYAYGVLLIFLFAVFFRPGFAKNYIILAVILFFLSITSIYGFLIVIALTSMMILEIIIDKELLRSISNSKARLLIALMIILLGLILSAYVMKPPADSGNSAVLANKFDLSRFEIVAGSFWNSYVPIPRLGRLSFWNTNILHDKLASCIMSLPLFLFFLFAFSKKIIVCFLFSFTTFLFIAFQYFVYPGFLRHSGHFFVILILCFWLSKYYQDDDKLKSFFNSRFGKYCDKNKIVVLNIILCIHLCVGLFAGVMEIFRPFTIAPRVANYIIENDFDNSTILAYIDIRASMIAPYINHPLYYPQGDRFGTFQIWDKKRTENIDEQIIVERAKRISPEKNSDIVFVLTKILENNYDSIAALTEFHYDSILDDEHYYLYIMKKNNIR